MFFDGRVNKGACPAGGAHQAQGFMFTLPFDEPETATAQRNWRFCDKCFSMFFDGAPNKGRCPAEGAHQAQGVVFSLPHDVPPTAGQDQWRFCDKCFAMFFDGAPNKGRCTAGGGHQAQGFMFVLPHTEVPPARTFHQDIATPSGTPLGGWIDLEIHGNGDYKITFQMHSSSVLGNFDFDLRAYLTAPGCPVFFFHHSGHVSGVDDSNYSETGNLPLLALYFPELLYRGMYSAAKDYSWGGIVGTLDRLANDLVI